jgi:glycosyltransferase involved in cell wall biosynthesis
VQSHSLVDLATDRSVGFVEISIVMPCLNEAETLAICITKAQWYIQQHHLAAEIIIADNGSTDGSQAIAAGLGVRVIEVRDRGYGSALRAGIAAAQGQYIIMGDADNSYDFSQLSPFIQQLRAGYDLVMGNRFKGGIQPGAMPPLHRYLGNPVLTWIGRLFFASPCQDFHCGLRGFRKDAIESLGLRTTGMEFASEMVVKATLYHLKIAEVPTVLSPDGRSRPPHLRSWRDGWRHLRFLLLYSPRWLFLYPGLLLMLVGFGSTLLLLSGPKGAYAAVFLHRHADRVSDCAVFDLHQSLCHERRLIADRSSVSEAFATSQPGSRLNGRHHFDFDGIWRHGLCL